jgi:hypothetical protein
VDTAIATLTGLLLSARVPYRTRASSAPRPRLPRRAGAARRRRSSGGQGRAVQHSAATYSNRRWSKGEYRNVRRALLRIARPVRRSAYSPGKPLIWQLR